MPPIVIIAESLQVAPTPATLQKTGAIISQGGTVLTQQQSALITQPDDLTPLLALAVNVSSASWSSGVYTLNLSTPIGAPVGQVIQFDWSGTDQPTLNSTWWMTVASTTQLSFSLATNPGTPTVFGSILPHSANEILAAVTTFFGMGFNQAVYILELGLGDVNTGVTSLSAYLTEFPNNGYTAGATGYFYLYLVPKNWDANASFLVLQQSYQSPAARTFFLVTTTLTNYTVYNNLMKGIFALIEAPTISKRPNTQTISSATWASNELTITVPNTMNQGEWFEIEGAVTSLASINGWHQVIAATSSSVTVWAPNNPGSITSPGDVLLNYFASTGAPAMEFTLAAVMWVMLNWDPSDTNKVPPLLYTFLFGVTPFPTKGHSALLDTLYAANINYVDTGAEGGISNAMVQVSNTMDGNPFNFWYAADWCAIQGDLQLANAIINGSNNPVNPLYYNQAGINTLEAVLAGVFSQAVTFGLVLFPPKQLALTGPDLANGLQNNQWIGNTVINAVPFIPYSQDNPGDYRQGKYKGFSAVFTPQLGFRQVMVNFVVSQFVATTSS